MASAPRAPASSANVVQLTGGVNVIRNRSPPARFRHAPRGRGPAERSEPGAGACRARAIRSFQESSGAEDLQHQIIERNPRMGPEERHCATGAELRELGAVALVLALVG